MKEKTITLQELGKTVMPIIGFWGPGDGFKEGRWDKKSLKTDEVFTLIKDAGFNMYLQGYDDWNNNAQGAKKAFEMCNKYNLFYYVSDRELCSSLRITTQTGEAKRRVWKKSKKRLRIIFTSRAWQDCSW